MKFNRFISDDSQTPYAPTWDFCIGSSNLHCLNCNALSRTCLDKEKEIKKLPLVELKDGSIFDGYTGLGKNSTTSRSPRYNLLTWDTPEVGILRNFIKKQVGEYNTHLGHPSPEKIYVTCWYNIMRWGQKIKPHLHAVHSQSYLSAHFTVQCKNTSTCYINPVNVLNDPEVLEKENLPGNFTIFPSHIPHYTTRHYSFIPRITIAMDIHLRPKGLGHDTTTIVVEL